MTANVEPAIVPLWGFTAQQERNLHHLRMKRIAAQQFDAGERRGMRLSIDDPVRRVKAYFDPWWTIHIHEGIGSRGFLVEDLIEVAVMQDPEGVYAGEKYDAQVAIPWGPKGSDSESAFDFVVARPLPVSVKSVDTGKRVAKLKPSSANIRQETRMLVEAGYHFGSIWHTWMASLAQMEAIGPFEHTLTEEAEWAYLAERERVSDAWLYWSAVKDVRAHPGWNDPVFWLETFELESTSGAFMFDTLDASGAVEARHRRFMQLRSEAKDAAEATEDAKEAIYERVREQIAAKRLTDPNAKSVVAYSGDTKTTYTLRKDGAIVVTEKPFTEQVAA